MSYITDAIIEIPLNSNIKYEYDENDKMIRCDRILNTSMGYPGNYGYVPQTLSPDGDPLDILVIMDYPLYPNTIISVKIIGVLFTTDEKGDDEKILAVPSEIIDSNYKSINDYTDLPKSLITKIIHFFKHYKDNEKERWVEVGICANREEAKLVYHKAIKRYIVNNKVNTELSKL